MRTEYELLKILLSYLPQWLDNENCNGMCLVIQDLNYASLITYDEYVLLTEYILSDKDNHPHEELGGYYFEEGKLEPRVKWLEKHIKLTKP